MKLKVTLLLLVIVFLSNATQAQRHDKEKYLQIKSMETGPWDFAPAWYYYFMHKGYSGAETYWRWRGFKSGFHVRFKESKSKVKRVLPTREQSAAVQLLKKNDVEEEYKHFKSVHDVEVKRALDRNVDAVYSSYKDDFLKINQNLLDGFDYILRESKNKLSPQVTELSKELNLLNERIAYIHQTGLGYELENAKREKEYIKTKKEMENLVSRTKYLALQAHMLY